MIICKAIIPLCQNKMKLNHSLHGSIQKFAVVSFVGFAYGFSLFILSTFTPVYMQVFLTVICAFLFPLFFRKIYPYSRILQPWLVFCIFIAIFTPVIAKEQHIQKNLEALAKKFMDAEPGDFTVSEYGQYANFLNLSLEKFKAIEKLNNEFEEKLKSLGWYSINLEYLSDIRSKKIEKSRNIIKESLQQTELHKEKLNYTFDRVLDELKKVLFKDFPAFIATEFWKGFSASLSQSRNYFNQKLDLLSKKSSSLIELLDVLERSNGLFYDEEEDLLLFDGSDKDFDRFNHLINQITNYEETCEKNYKVFQQKKQ